MFDKGSFTSFMMNIDINSQNIIRIREREREGNPKECILLRVIQLVDTGHIAAFQTLTTLAWPTSTTTTAASASQDGIASQSRLRSLSSLSSSYKVFTSRILML